MVQLIDTARVDWVLPSRGNVPEKPTVGCGPHRVADVPQRHEAGGASIGCTKPRRVNATGLRHGILVQRIG